LALDARAARAAVFRPTRMIPHARSPRAASGASARPMAVALLLALLLGGAFHQLHHLRDPGCDADAAGGAHACPCAVLHGFTSPAPSLATPAPVAMVARYEAPAPHRTAPARRAGRIASRAPPLA